MKRVQVFPCIAAAAALSTATLPAIARQAEKSWLEVGYKAHSLLIDPATLEAKQVFDPLPHPMGICSPDGKRVAFIATEPGSERHTDLFIADVDLAQPSGKANIRRLTTHQDRPTNPHWLPEDRGLVFLAGEGPLTRAWFVGLSPGAQPFPLSDQRYRAYDLSVAANGDAAYLQHKGSRHKQQFIDLVIQSPSELATRSAAGLRKRVPLRDQHISGYAISPDGKMLAWSGLGSLFLVTLATGESREIPLQGVHRQLLNHTAHDIDWRPDGQVIALRCGFLGGIAVIDDGKGEPAWPRMFADDKAFFVPVEWTPTPEQLKVGSTVENFPLPTADDPKAEVSPPAGDESKPWWVRELPEHILGVKWVSAEEARRRVESSGK